MTEHGPDVGSAVDATSGVDGRHGATQIGAHSGEPAFDAVNPPSAMMMTSAPPHASSCQCGYGEPEKS